MYEIVSSINGRVGLYTTRREAVMAALEMMGKGRKNGLLTVRRAQVVVHV